MPFKTVCVREHERRKPLQQQLIDVDKYQRKQEIAPSVRVGRSELALEENVALDLRGRTPENYCPVCGGSVVIGMFTNPGKRGQVVWACRKCKKSWDRGQWTGIMDWNQFHKVDFLDQYQEHEKEPKEEELPIEDGPWNEGRLYSLQEEAEEKLPPEKQEIRLLWDEDAKPGEKYLIIQTDKSGWPYRLVRKANDRGTAQAILKAALPEFKAIDPSYELMIVPAKNMEDARTKVRNRGKSDFIVTGETYANKDLLAGLGLKYDHARGGYRGKLSPEKAELIAAKPDLSVSQDSEFTYEQQRESRIARAEKKAERYEGYAEHAQARGEARLDKAHKIGDMIPFGQPILVGHHSEGRARSDIAKIISNESKGREELSKAADYQSRAEGVVAQAHRVKGETEARRAKRREEMRPLLVPGARVNSVVFGDGTILKTFKKSVTVQWDRHNAGSSYAPPKFSIDIDAIKLYRGK